MAENKDYNFDNFDDTKIYGKHFKNEEVSSENFSDEFDIDDINDADDTNISSFSTLENKTDDYGDDFYSDGSNFENDDIDSTRIFDPADDYDMRDYQEVKDNNKKDKKKNVAIIALTITLAVVIFVFSLIFFLSGSDKDEDKKKETEKPSETVVQTQEQEEETQYIEPTWEEQTQAEEFFEPTQYTPEPEPEPTQAPQPQPEPEPTQAPPVEEETIFVEEETQEQFQEIFE